MFCMNRTVSFSETAPDGLLRISDLTDYYQDVCTVQSAERGVGLEALRRRGAGWVVSSWQIIVNRYPALDEKVKVGTAPYEFKGAMGKRNFILESDKGEILSYANSIWTYLDLERMAPARIAPEVIQAYEQSEPLDMEYAPRRIAVPESLAALAPVEVKYHHLDSNGHVNNAQYIAMAEDLVPEGRRAAQIRIEYRASAVDGDIIMPYVSRDEERGLYTAVLADAGMNPYVIVEFKKEI